MDEMNSGIPEHAPANKVHTWMLILLVWIAAFSLVAVGLLLTKGSSTTLSATDITAACQNGSINALTTNLTRISDACNTVPDTDKTESVAVAIPATTGTTYDAKDSQGYLPKLTLPQGWTANVFINNAKADIPNTPFASFGAMKGIGFDCNECGGVTAPAQFWIEANDAAYANIYAVSELKADYEKNAKTYQNVTVTEKLENGTQLVEINGTFTPDGVVAHAGIFHIIKYITGTRFVEITFYEDHGATNAEWLTVKNSLDWSTVK